MKNLKFYRDMKAEEKFNALFAHLMDMDAAELTSVDFSRLCRDCGADVKDMDNRSYVTLGLSGDEIIHRLRKGILHDLI